MWLRLTRPVARYIQHASLGWADGLLYTWIQLAGLVPRYIQHATLGWATSLLFTICSTYVGSLVPKYLQRTWYLFFHYIRKILNKEGGMIVMREWRIHHLPQCVPTFSCILLALHSKKYFEQGGDSWFVSTVVQDFTQSWWGHAMKFSRWNEL